MNILWNDVSRPVKQWMNNIRQQLTEHFARAREASGTSVADQVFYFTDPPWNGHPARIIVKEYLDLMEQEVAAWEIKFA